MKDLKEQFDGSVHMINDLRMQLKTEESNNDELRRRLVELQHFEKEVKGLQKQLEVERSLRFKSPSLGDIQDFETNSKIELLEVEKQSLTETIKELEEELHKVNQTNQEIVAQIQLEETNLKRKDQSMAFEMDALRKQISDLTNEKIMLIQDQERMEKQMRAANEENQKLQLGQERLNSQLQNTHESFQQIELKTESQGEKQRKLTIQNEEFKSQIQSLDKERNELITEFRNEMEDIQDQNSKLVNLYEHQIDYMQSRMLEEIDSPKDNKVELIKDLSQREAMIGQLKKENGDLRKQVQKLTRKSQKPPNMSVNSDISEIHSDQLGDLSRKLAFAESKYVKAQNQNLEAKSEITRERMERQFAEKELEKVAGLTQEEKSKTVKLQKDSSKQVKSLKTEIAGLKAELEHFRSTWLSPEGQKKQKQSEQKSKDKI